MSLREGRKQVYNPAGIMQRAGKRSADSRITLATVARAGCVSTGRGRESGLYFSTDLTGTRPYFRLPQSRLLRESREHRNRAVGSSGWSRKRMPRRFPRRWIRASRMVFVSVTFVPRSNWNRNDLLRSEDRRCKKPVILISTVISVVQSGALLLFFFSFLIMYYEWCL